MASGGIHFVWHIHQPFFVSDDELKARIGSTYLPILSEFISRKMPFSLNITGGTLARLRRIAPHFVASLVDMARDHHITFVGSVAHHAFLAWLPITSLRAQLLVDRQEKQDAKLPIFPALLPTDLSWSHRVGLTTKAMGYNQIFVSSEVRELIDTVPHWHSVEGNLYPSPTSSAPAGTTSMLALKLEGPASIHLLLNENVLTNCLRKNILADDISAESACSRFVDAVNSVEFYRLKVGDVAFFVEDLERFIPKKMSKFLSFLDVFQKCNYSLISLPDALSSGTSREISYAPSCSAQGGDDMWTHSVDDRWFKVHLERVSGQLDEIFDLTSPKNPAEFAIRDKLLSIQDSSFYYWHFVPRSRSEFHARMMEVESWIQQQRHN